ncbi:hypothetical protein BC832DRAFT_590284 [Gaertneriomyces semiglobifer]|nr:hypothetical protein BC832DRAFT_590284 [Gaertneriomyces semiglobifer]
MAPVVLPLEITVDRYYLSASLKALIHSILFHRRFTPEKPVDVDVDSLGVTYVKLENPEMERAVEEKVRMLEKALDPTTGRNKGQLALMFFEKKSKQKKSWFAKTEEDTCWEVCWDRCEKRGHSWYRHAYERNRRFQQWVLSVAVREVRSEREQLDSRRLLQRDLQQALMAISTTTNEQRDHIPPLKNEEPFPVEMAVSTTSDASWTSVLKQMISSSGPWLSAT